MASKPELQGSGTARVALMSLGSTAMLGPTEVKLGDVQFKLAASYFCPPTVKSSCESTPKIVKVGPPKDVNERYSMLPPGPTAEGLGIDLRKKFHKFQREPRRATTLPRRPDLATSGC